MSSLLSAAGGSCLSYSLVKNESNVQRGSIRLKKKNPRYEIHTRCGDLFMVPGSFRRWHLREAAFTAAFHLIPPVKSGCRQAEQESRILHEGWQQKSVMRLSASAVVLRRSAVLGADICARSLTRAPAPPPVFRVGVPLELKRSDVTNNPSVKLKKS